MKILLPFFVWTYVGVITILMVYGLHRLWVLFLYWYYHKRPSSLIPKPQMPDSWRPAVTVQLPLYNERYVAERLIDAVAAFDYPHDRLEIQVLDDSTDETVSIVQKKVDSIREKGIHIHHMRRDHRTGFKAGALAWGLAHSHGEFVAIFDADFVPPSDFLKATLPHFQDAKVGMVQTRWGHINASYSLLTRLQAIFLDGHFLLEHTARHKSGAFFNFNGTAGIWRKRAIETAGGWNARTLTEDLDLSYRAQLAGWRFVYDPDYVCPAELPVDIHAFESQQKRWTKGAIQVARYLLKDIWKASIPFHVKLEATIHLTSNVGYLLTVMVSALLLPSLFLRDVIHFHLGWIELGVFFSTSFSIILFYGVSQRELYPDWKWRMRDLPALMSFGIGMCWANTRAVVEGLVGYRSDFIRTPKYNIQASGDGWQKKTYALERKKQKWIPIFFGAYALFTLSFAMATNHWTSIPFILLFVFGYGTITGLSWRHGSSQ